MRIRLIIFFCLISFSASAQIWEKLGFKKKHIVLPALPPAKGHQFVSAGNPLKLNALQVQPVTFETCEFTLVATSKMVMEQAKHNMRFRVYNDASYNFSDLAACMLNCTVGLRLNGIICKATIYRANKTMT